MAEDLPRRRRVVSLSLSARNADARIVARGLVERDVALTHGGPLILEWAAAYLEGRAAQPIEDASGISDDELDALLDDF